MESDLTQSETFLKLWVWVDKNKKQILWGLIILVVVGIGIAFWFAHQNATQDDANEDLSKVVSPSAMPGGAEITADSLLKVNADYPATEAGQRALLLAAGQLFTEGKYDEARAQFEKFIKDYNDSKFVAQAALGEAACLDAQGKTAAAAAAYQGMLDHYGNESPAPLANLALARLLEAQGKFKEAKSHLDEITRVPGTVGSEANIRLRQLLTAHPELEPASLPAPLGKPPVNLEKH